MYTVHIYTHADVDNIHTYIHTYICIQWRNKGGAEGAARPGRHTYGGGNFRSHIGLKTRLWRDLADLQNLKI